jgi:hypothetical protein
MDEIVHKNVNKNYSWKYGQKLSMFSSQTRLIRVQKKIDEIVHKNVDKKCSYFLVGQSKFWLELFELSSLLARAFFEPACKLQAIFNVAQLSSA